MEWIKVSSYNWLFHLFNYLFVFLVFYLVIYISDVFILKNEIVNHVKYSNHYQLRQHVSPNTDDACMIPKIPPKASCAHSINLTTPLLLRCLTERKSRLCSSSSKRPAWLRSSKRKRAQALPPGDRCWRICAPSFRTSLSRMRYPQFCKSSVYLTSRSF